MSIAARLIAWTAGVLAFAAFLVVAAATWVYYADLDFLKPTLESYVRQATGRDFAIRGDFHLDVDSSISLIATDLQLEDVEPTERPLARADRLSLTLDYRAILSRTLVIESVELDGMVLNLESFEDGSNNWTLDEDDSTDSSWRLLLKQANLQNANVSFQRPDLARPIDIVIDYAEQTHHFGDDLLDTRIDATINGRAISVAGTVGTFANLLRGEDVEYDLSGRFDTLSIESRGRIDHLLEPSRPAVTFSVSSPDIDHVTEMLGLPDYGEGAVQLDFALTPLAEAIELEVTGNLAQLEIEASGRASELRELRRAEFDVIANGPHLGRFLRLFNVHDVPDEPFRLTGDVRRTDARLVIDDATLEVSQATFRVNGVVDGFPNLDAADIRIEMAGPNLAPFSKLLGFRGRFEEPFELDATIQHDGRGQDTVQARLTIEPLAVRLEGPLGEPPSYEGTRMELSASGPDLHHLASILLDDAAAAKFLPAEPFELQTAVAVTSAGIEIEGLSADVRDAKVRGSMRLSADERSFAIEVSLPDLERLAMPPDGWQPEPAPFALQAQGSLTDERWTIDASRISLGDASIVWHGILDHPPDVSATDLVLSADVPSLARLGTFRGERLPDRPLLVDAHLDGDANELILDKLHGSLGETSFTGALRVAFGESRPTVDADLGFDLLDLRDWEDDDDPAQDAPPDRLIADYPLPLERLDTVNGTLDVTAKTVRMTNITFTDALVKATLRDGDLAVSDLDIVAPRGRVDGTLRVTPDGDVAEVQFTLRSNDLSLNLAGDPADLSQAMTYAFDVDLSGRGATTGQIAATLNGRAVLDSDGGRFHNRGLSLLYSGFGRELLTALNPLAKETPYTQINCAIVPFDVKDGRLTTSPNIVVQTESINLVSKGFIDLSTENLEFTFNSKPRRRLSISASEFVNPYIRVAGTLTSPRLTINRTGTAVAAITGGWSILAQAAWNRTFRRKDPCG